MADLCFGQLQLMHAQMHVHTGIKDFLAIRIASYTVTNKSACARSKHDDKLNNIGIHQFFTRQTFPNPDSSKLSFVKIFHHQNFAPYGI